MASAACLVAATAGAGAASHARAGDGIRTVSYHGYRVAVPDTWRMVDLAADPDACVRFDVPTVYLGRPADQAACPADLAGRTIGIVIEPIDDASADRVTAQTAIAPRGTATARQPASHSDTIHVAVPSAGVLVTAAHTPDTEDDARRILASATLGQNAEELSEARLLSRRTQETTAVAALAAGGPQPGTYLGRGFDTCAAPSQSAMNAWRTGSPYGAIGIYISGASRSCAQPNLTATWVTNQTNNGWRLIPIELGMQAPCGTRTPKMSSDTATALSQGATAASSAVNAAQALGIPAGSVIYNDIEHYPSTASCKAAVLSYLSGWTQRLHALGYLSGMYSSGSSGIADVCGAYNDTRYLRVDHLWFAWWNGAADTDAGQYCPDAYYANHQRLHQYAGDVTETWNGVQMSIDRNYLDVAGGTEPQPPAFSVIVDNTTAGQFTASTNWGTSSYSAERSGPDYRFAEPIAASDTAWYRANIPATASYEVSVWYPADPGYNDSTPYLIVTPDGNQSVRVNQRLNGGQWVSLGVFTLPAGDGDRVGVSRWTAGTGYVIADAIRITRV
ncbi:glycoside hydrolase domain-containing protein [Phytohabitans rumicis]|nr:glycoside hydrolase domain-containing protein [Phytohabitans rumicis]